MLPVSYRRIIAEMQEIKWMIEKKQLESVEILEYQELKYAVFLLSGPMDSPYEGYWFRIKLQWPEVYPFKPPKCKLLDKIWNPYIDFQKKQLCIDILNTECSPAMKTHHYILSIISLLSETKLNKDQNFMNPNAAIQMIQNYPYFCEHARQICEKQSFKKKEIYSNDMRGIPEEHNIIVQGNLIPDLISENLNTNQYGKKTFVQEQLKFKNLSKRRQNQLELEKLTEQQIKAEIQKFRQEIRYNLKHYNMTRPPN